MIPSYIQSIPKGDETGTFLALDLGGTNLRVCEVQLLGDSKWTMKQQKYKVSDALKTGDVSHLFDYMSVWTPSYRLLCGQPSHAGRLG